MPAAGVTSGATSSGTQVVVVVSPVTATVNACTGSLQLGAAVTGTADNRVNWQVVEGNAGAITSSGLYTPPATGTGIAHVTATSVADPTKVATATITVAEKVLGVSVTPASSQTTANGQVIFTAMVETSCGTFAAQ